MSITVGLATRGVIAPGNNGSLALVTRGLELICSMPLTKDLDPNQPIHITDVFPGMQIRIALKPGMHMIQRRTKKGNFLVPSDVRSRRRGYEKSVLVGSVTVNNPAAGELSMVVSETIHGQIYRATVPYNFMGVAQRIIPIKTLVETGSRPTARAKGTKLVGGQLMNPRYKRVPIKF